MLKCKMVKIPHGDRPDSSIGDKIELDLTYEQCDSLITDAYSVLALSSKQEDRDRAIDNLRTFISCELLECEHDFTEMVDVDDERHIGSDGELHEISNPDLTRCLVCGKIFNPRTEEWEDAD